MTGDTHVAGGVLWSVLGFIILKENNLLLQDVNPLSQLAIIYPYCVWGSTISDLDHHWDSCPNKSDVNKVINKSLHLTSKSYHNLNSKLTGAEKKKSIRYRISKFFCATHRSWQTHSELTLFLLLILLYMVVSGKFTSLGSIDTAILSLIMMGTTLGVFSHLLLDMLTTKGIVFVTGILINKIFKLLTKQDFKIVVERLRFVPKSSKFATDTDWEHFIYKVVRFLTVLSVVYVIVGFVFPDLIPRLVNAFPYTISFK